MHNNTPHISWHRGELATHFRFVKGITARYAKSFFLATQFLPQHKRWATYAVYGLCRYADNIVDKPRGRSPETVREELKNLALELRRAYIFGESEHPIVKPFIAVALHYGIKEEHAQELLRGVEMDLTICSYANFTELYRFCYRVASVVGLMMTPVLGYEDEEAFVYAEKLGIAMQLTNILRDIAEDKKLGRLYLPLNEMRRFGVSPDDIDAAQDSTGLRELVRFQAERARRYYEEAEPGIRMLAADARFTIYAAGRIYRGIIDKLAEKEYNPFLGRVYVAMPQKIAILLQEILRSKIGRRRERALQRT